MSQSNDDLLNELNSLPTKEKKKKNKAKKAVEPSTIPEEPKPEEKPEVKPAETVGLTPDVMKEFTGAINGLSDMIKKSNMINDGYEPKTALEKGEEVLASLINPPAKKK